MKVADFIIKMHDSNCEADVYVSDFDDDVFCNPYTSGDIEEATTMCYSTAKMLTNGLNLHFNRHGLTFSFVSYDTEKRNINK